MQKPIVNRQIFKQDYRNKRVIIGAHGIIQEQVVKLDDTIGGIEFIKKGNVIYIAIVNLDCRRKRLEIQANTDYTEIFKICFIA